MTVAAMVITEDIIRIGTIMAIVIEITTGAIETMIAAIGITTAINI
jgi:sporulation protein YlmC with PRC-barrel domain